LRRTRIMFPLGPSSVRNILIAVHPPKLLKNVQRKVVLEAW
jgi:hypothetical protein